MFDPFVGVAVLTVWLVWLCLWGVCLDGHKSSDLYLAGIIVRALALLWLVCGCFSFTESLILAQDERWWRA